MPANRQRGGRLSQPVIAATPLVRKMAELRAVDLAKVGGTGVGGRITKADVMMAAVEATLQRARESGLIAAGRMDDYREMGRVDPAGAVEVIESLSVEPTGWFGEPLGGAETLASARGNQPTVRASAGALPPFCASGLDPQVLRSVPAPVRPAMAAASTTQEAYALLDRYRGLSDDDAQVVLSRDASVPEHLAYQWANETGWIDPGSDQVQREFTSEGQPGMGPTADELTARAAAAWSDKQAAQQDEQARIEAEAGQRHRDGLAAAQRRRQSRG